MQQVEEMKESLNLPVNKKIILYSGNIGEKQGLEIAIDVAEKLINFDFIFVIVGQGAGKQKLENLVKKKKLTNVIFHSLQPYELLPALLKSADCHLVIQRRGAADSVLPSKLTNILAVGGNSVITAEPQTELGQLCNKYPGIAILVEPESIDSLSDGIFLALKMPPINVIAITYAQKYLQKNVIIETFLESIKI
jgi:colanic acid biosynthesis glycosyl transferase WcaI